MAASGGPVLFVPSKPRVNTHSLNSKTRPSSYESGSANEKQKEGEEVGSKRQAEGPVPIEEKAKKKKKHEGVEVYDASGARISQFARAIPVEEVKAKPQRPATATWKSLKGEIERRLAAPGNTKSPDDIRRELSAELKEDQRDKYAPRFSKTEMEGARSGSEAYAAKLKLREKIAADPARYLCYAFRSGKGCSRGDDCLYLHDAELAKTAPPFRSNKPCYSWQNRGSCGKGDKCAYSHADSAPASGAAAPPPSAPPPKSTLPCYRFRDSGGCAFGDRCRYTH